MPRNFYVYIKFRPDGSPCYVGKGKGNRHKVHEKFGTNRHLVNIIRNAGGSVPTVIIRSGLTEDEAFSMEVAFIKAIGREAHGGPLVNLTDGGNGSSGWNHSEETKTKLGKSNCKAETRAKISEAMTGKKPSEEARAAMSAAAKARPPMSEETKQKIGDGGRGRVLTAEHKEALRLANRGNKHSLGIKRSSETLSRMSASHKGHKRNVGRPCSPETRLKLSASNKRTKALNRAVADVST
jgi:hypothetical protein